VKKRFNIVLVLCISLISVGAVDSGIGLEEQLITSEKRVIWEAVAKKQMDVLRSSLAAEYLDVSDVGVFTKSETLELIPDLNLRDYSLDKFKVIRIGKDSAIVTYEAIQNWTIKGQEAPSHVRATSVWVNRGGKWLVIFHQESTIT
jgi:hypothetical protein